MTSLMKGNLSLNEIREVKDYMDGICNTIIKKKQSNKPKGKLYHQMCLLKQNISHLEQNILNYKT